MINGCAVKNKKRMNVLNKAWSKRGWMIISFIICHLSFSMMLASCEKDDNLSVPELIVGTWVVDSYEVLNDPDTEYTVYIDHFEFRKDQTFTVYYGLAPGQETADSPDSGTYEAGEAYLRLEYGDNGQGGERKVLCEIITFTETTMQITYRHPDSDIVANIKVKKK